FGSKRTLADGTTVVADEAYIRESLADPTAKLVKGYIPSMQSFADILSESQKDAIVAYIQSQAK
ncbi:MAG TPA: cytochrome c oxidase subunit II, partial [Polyangiaceae bacterium]|nr:cytochrome c oxidase subunit II [Polyangiaceae bacterium]